MCCHNLPCAHSLSLLKTVRTGLRFDWRLFAAIVLNRLGHVVRIFERNSTPLLHNQGTGVVAGGDTQAFFDKYDATRPPIAVTSKIRKYLYLQGNQILEEDMIQKMTSWHLLYHLLRGDFDGVESGYCKVPEPFEADGNGAYEYGQIVKSVKDVGEQVQMAGLILWGYSAR